MRRSVLSIATVSMLCALVIGPTMSASGAPKDAFVGTWTSIDTDGSNQILFIMGSGSRGRHAVMVEDDAATVACQGDVDPAFDRATEPSPASSFRPVDCTRSGRLQEEDRRHDPDHAEEGNGIAAYGFRQVQLPWAQP